MRSDPVLLVGSATACKIDSLSVINNTSLFLFLEDFHAIEVNIFKLYYFIYIYIIFKLYFSFSDWKFCFQITYIIYDSDCNTINLETIIFECLIRYLSVPFTKGTFLKFVGIWLRASDICAVCQNPLLILMFSLRFLTSRSPAVASLKPSEVVDLFVPE